MICPLGVMSEFQDPILQLDSLFLNRVPRPVLREHPQGILWNFRHYQLVLKPLSQSTFEVLEVVAKTPVGKVVLDRNDIYPGQVVNTADLLRIVIEKSREAKMATEKFELDDKTRKTKINAGDLRVQPFQPHFGVGPTYYGIIDASRLSWLAEHEYASKKEADSVLKDIRSGKVTDLRYRGF